MGERYKVLIVTAKFPSWVLSFSNLQRVLFYFKKNYTTVKRTWTLNSGSGLYPNFVWTVRVTSVLLSLKVFFDHFCKEVVPLSQTFWKGGASITKKFIIIIIITSSPSFLCAWRPAQEKRWKKKVKGTVSLWWVSNGNNGNNNRK